MMRTIAIVTALAAVVANVAAFAPSQGELILIYRSISFEIIGECREFPRIQSAKNPFIV
jgi:hypothetical protein